MGEVMFWMAVIASVAGFLTTTKVIQRYSWTASALIPPFVVAFTGLLFFYFLFFPEAGFSWIAGFFSTSPLVVIVALGSAQNCLSRASKYTFFDATKEIAFIPLSNESKKKGKAAIDGVGSRLGKSGGSAIYQGLIVTFSSIAGSIPWVAAIFLIIVCIWSFSVIYLGKQFDHLIAENGKLTIPDEPILANKS